MGIFYKYKCRNCGKKYGYLPKNCECCGTELSFICPMDIWSAFPEHKQTKDCEEIFEIAFPFGKKSRIKLLERKIGRLTKELSGMQEEISTLQNDKDNFEMKMNIKNATILSLQTEISELKHSNVQYKAVIKQYKSGWIYTTPNASQDMIDAVKYAMKKSHPDNGGNAEDFVRFKKCYEELTERCG